MSATGRSAVRRVDDFYETPAWVTHALLASDDVSKHFCDPCAGKGAILQAAREFGYVPWGIELNAEYGREDSAIVCADFMQVDLTPRFTRQDIVMNPPYRQALSFVSHALQVLLASQAFAQTNVEQPKVHALLRLSFLESKARSSFLRANMPAKIRVLSKRPSFTGKGTDACAYAWFTWHLYGSHPTLLEIL